MFVSRRSILVSGAAATLGFGGLRRLFGATHSSAVAGLGPLTIDPHRLLDLPAGFSYSIISRVGDEMDDGLLVPGLPDGMAAFPGPAGKVILIRNHELDPEHRSIGPYGAMLDRLSMLAEDRAYDFGYGKSTALGGTTNVLFDPATGKVERQVMSLAGTESNCAGGPTPWGTWITCEETVSCRDSLRECDHGFAFEVPPTFDNLPIEPRPIKAMGRFRREAVGIDPRTGIVYQSEDLADGLLYRFIPNAPGGPGRPCDWSAGGRLQALAVIDRDSLNTSNWPKKGPPTGPPIPQGLSMSVRWIDLDDPESASDDLRKRGFRGGAASFARCEGVWFAKDHLYFICTEGGKNGGGQIWRYWPSPSEGTSREGEKPGVLELFLEPNNRSIANMPDNLTVAPWGDLIVCEDNEGSNRLLGVTPKGSTYVLAKNVANDSEFAGVTFSPDGETLFVNMQAVGLTLAIRGPWNAVRHA